MPGSASDVMSVSTTQLFFAHFSVENRVQIVLIWLGFAFIVFAVILNDNCGCASTTTTLVQSAVGALCLRQQFVPLRCVQRLGPAPVDRRPPEAAHEVRAGNAGLR
jgi:hypothetical protein